MFGGGPSCSQWSAACWQRGEAEFCFEDYAVRNGRRRTLGLPKNKYLFIHTLDVYFFVCNV